MYELYSNTCAAKVAGRCDMVTLQFICLQYLSNLLCTLSMPDPNPPKLASRAKRVQYNVKYE